MTAPAHKPGPWTLNVSLLNDESICAVHVIDQANEASMAQVSIYDDATTMSNARLMAASPDLKAVAAVVANPRLGASFSEAAVSGDAHDDLPVTVVITIGDIRRARAAIAKAEGRA